MADEATNRVRLVTPDGWVTTIAGGGGINQGGFADGPGATARFSGPTGVAWGKDGAIYVADQSNHVIRRLRKAD